MTWEQVLEQFKKYSSKDNHYYMLTVNKGSENEERTRFLTYAEALKKITYEVEKARFTSKEEDNASIQSK
ncbi:MAG: hypothetical protein KGH64_00685 [Candidatus Micrarchaeota archaeon]|nr:hypothetical protein [Candidatus Micrarchaeota archaeon]